MPRGERVFNVAMGLSVIGWGLMGFASSVHQRPWSVVITISFLHLCVGTLFLMRARAQRHGSWQTCAIAIPAVVVGGWVFQYSPNHWNSIAQALFVMGGVLTIFSFAFLGKCFAILPAIRGTATRGPYAWIRHPAYFGELSMVAGCLAALPLHWFQFVAMALAIVFCVVRIRAEESLLSTSENYRAYTNSVRWRLLPGVW